MPPMDSVEHITKVEAGESSQVGKRLEGFKAVIPIQFYVVTTHVAKIDDGRGV